MSLKPQEFLVWEGCDGEGLFYKDRSCPFSSGLVHTASCVPGAQQRLWKEMGKMRDDGMRGRQGRVSATGPRAQEHPRGMWRVSEVGGTEKRG